MKRIQILFLGLLLGISLLKAQSFDKAKMDSLFSIIENAEKGMGSISLFHDGKEVYNRSYGYADIENKIKADKETRYRIGSISKTFTATIIMKLIEEGKLSLTSALKDFYPQVENSDKITVEHLLQHRSGILNFTNSSDYIQWSIREHTKEHLLDRIVSKGVSFLPGEKHEYSNSNFVLLTFIAEDVSGKTFSDLLEQIIVKPCKLKNTYVGKKIGFQGHEAYSYKKISDWEKYAQTDMSVPLGAGSIVSTPYDLNVFLYNLFSGKIVSEKSLGEMINLKDNFGFGLFKVPFYTMTGYGHTGGIDGFQANTYYFPESKVSVSLTENGVVYPLNDIIIGTLSIYFDKNYELPEFTEAIILKTEDLDQYLGVYSTAAFPLKITITKKRNILIAQGSGQPAFVLECFGENKFRYDPAKLKMEFIPDENKMILEQFGMTYEMKRE